MPGVQSGSVPQKYALGACPHSSLPGCTHLSAPHALSESSKGASRHDAQSGIKEPPRQAGAALQTHTSPAVTRAGQVGQISSLLEQGSNLACCSLSMHRVEQATGQPKIALPLWPRQCLIVVHFSHCGQTAKHQDSPVQSGHIWRYHGLIHLCY